MRMYHFKNLPTFLAADVFVSKIDGNLENLSMATRKRTFLFFLSTIGPAKSICNSLFGADNSDSGLFGKNLDDLAVQERPSDILRGRQHSLLSGLRAMKTSQNGRPQLFRDRQLVLTITQLMTPATLLQNCAM